MNANLWSTRTIPAWRVKPTLWFWRLRNRFGGRGYTYTAVVVNGRVTAADFARLGPGSGL